MPFRSSEGHCHHLVACIDTNESQPKGSCKQKNLCSIVHCKANTIFTGVNGTCTSLFFMFFILASLLYALSCHIPSKCISDFNLRLLY
jgi:hypothetical protein